MTAHASVAFTWLILTLVLRYCSAVQCFSCEGSGLNEVAANINCLEQGYLENCDDFYEYYTKVITSNLVLDILITFLAYMYSSVGKILTHYIASSETIWTRCNMHNYYNIQNFEQYSFHAHRLLC